MEKLKYSDSVSLRDNLKAIFNWTEFAVREITEGRVQTAQNDITSAKETEALTLELAADHEARICEMELGVK